MKDYDLKGPMPFGGISAVQTDEDTKINMDELMHTMASMKAQYKPEDLYNSTVVHVKFYEQIKKVAAPSAGLSSGLGSFCGIEVLSLSHMPEDEALMFKEKRDAHKFVSLAHTLGYEEAKKQMALLINIRNLSNGNDS